VGQFHMWGTGPRYIEFLRWKRKLAAGDEAVIRRDYPFLLLRHETCGSVH
jgi:hypothetical protein